MRLLPSGLQCFSMCQASGLHEGCKLSPLGEGATDSVSEADTVFGRESFNENKSLIESGSVPTTCRSL